MEDAAKKFKSELSDAGNNNMNKPRSPYLYANTFAPNAQQFVVVGSNLWEELHKYELFKQYFEDKKEKLTCLSGIHQFRPEDYMDLGQTLFIVKYFDINPFESINKTQNHPLTPGGKSQLSLSACGDTPRHVNVDNNNHFATPNMCRKIGEESEAESIGGYTTDYDDIEEESMLPPPLPPKPVIIGLTDFDDGECFNTLMAHKCSMMGSIALMQSIRNLKSMSESIRMVPSERPLHNLAMHKTLITFSGIADKEEAQRLLTLTRYMGAKSREDVTNRTTHLVAGNPRGQKYRRALELGLSIMNVNWVRESFRLAQRDFDFDASFPEIIQHYKLKPFHGLHMAFVGFKQEDVDELSELTIANEGIIADAADLCCSHIVVDAISGDTNAQLLSTINQTSNAHIVYKEWFWASLEMEGKANEDSYSVPGFKNQNRRSSRPRRASTGYNSFSNLLSPALDYSRSPDSMSVNIPDKQSSMAQSVVAIAEEQPDLGKLTGRHRACLELLQTEKNYVHILETIVTLFKLPLDNPDAVDPVLPMTDVKIIFGNLTPIYDVHKKMLGTLIALIQDDWKETNCIGKVFVTHAIELLKAYPPFVNFFEDTKKTINTCDQKYPRFHAFLRRCQSKIECNRESLTEMLIRPVQRLPSISLLLTELIKRTDESNPDKKYLVEALDNIRRVMNSINEDKRKTEGQIAMFDIVNNIEDCPPNLLSAQRRFICKVEARLLFMSCDNGIMPSKSHKVILILFSDLVEICKVRSLGRSHSSKGTRTYVPMRRGITQSQATRMSSNKKEHRHLDELRLSDVMNIYKKCQSIEMNDAFVIQARPTQKYEQNFRYYPFVIEDDSMSKAQFIEKMEDCLCSCDDPEQVSEYMSNDLPPISNTEIDFGYANLLVSTMGKSRLSRVLSIRQSLLSPSMKLQRIHHHH